jgi:hypothetical protein
MIEIVSPTVQPPEIPTYPILKEHIHSDLVVLFVGPKTGVVMIASEKSNNVGYFLADGWQEDLFEPYSGEITISND